jgi:hypothetical protein
VLGGTEDTDCAADGHSDGCSGGCAGCSL